MFAEYLMTSLLKIRNLFCLEESYIEFGLTLQDTAYLLNHPKQAGNVRSRSRLLAKKSRFFNSVVVISVWHWFFGNTTDFSKSAYFQY